MILTKISVSPDSIMRVVLATVLVGCESGKMPTYPVHGKVTFSDGKPLSTGWVSFRSIGDAKGISAGGQIQPDGTFRLATFERNDGAVEGRHQALVMIPVRGERDDFKDPLPPPPIDGRFSNFDSSGLEFTVSTDPAKNQFVIQVTPPPAPR